MVVSGLKVVGINCVDSNSVLFSQLGAAISQYQTPYQLEQHKTAVSNTLCAEGCAADQQVFDVEELRFWASYRGQTLARTGMPTFSSEVNVYISDFLVGLHWMFIMMNGLRHRHCNFASAWLLLATYLFPTRLIFMLSCTIFVLVITFKRAKISNHKSFNCCFA